MTSYKRLVGRVIMETVPVQVKRFFLKFPLAEGMDITKDSDKNPCTHA
jgi:hypothetical protein